MVTNIVNSLGLGSGLDTSQLVTDLLAASQGVKLSQLDANASLNSSRISAMAATQSALSTFSAAVKETLNGTGFVGDLVSGRQDLALATVLDGTRPEGLPASVEVVQIAVAQREISDVFASASTAVGQRTLTINNSGGSFEIVIDGTNNSLTGMRDAINASNSGVTAMILTDNAGARLILEGQEGVANAFTITQGGVSPAMNLNNIATTADSIVKVDGIELTNSSNTITGAIPGVQISLLAAEVGTKFTINGDSAPLDVASLVTEFVAAYNSLRTALNDATKAGAVGISAGPLSGDRGAREVIRMLGQLTSTQLTDVGDFKTLADIGVRTENDGTLSINQARLNAAIASDSGAIKLMLEPVVTTGTQIGLSGALDAIVTTLEGDSGALTVAQERLEAIQESFATMREKIELDSERMREQLENSFAGLERQLSILRSTQSYLEQQFASFYDD